MFIFHFIPQIAEPLSLLAAGAVRIAFYCYQRYSRLNEPLHTVPTAGGLNTDHGNFGFISQIENFFLFHPHDPLCL